MTEAMLLADARLPVGGHTRSAGLEPALRGGLLCAAQLVIPRGQLWVNPDCGLKTRQWGEVLPALTAMVSAAKTLRASA